MLDRRLSHKSSCPHGVRLGFGLRLRGTDHNHLLALTVSNVKTRGRQRVCSSLTVSAMHIKGTRRSEHGWQLVVKPQE